MAALERTHAQIQQQHAQIRAEMQQIRMGLQQQTAYGYGARPLLPQPAYPSFPPYPALPPPSIPWQPQQAMPPMGLGAFPYHQGGYYHAPLPPPSPYAAGIAVGAPKPSGVQKLGKHHAKKVKRRQTMRAKKEKTGGEEGRKGEQGVEMSGVDENSRRETQPAGESERLLLDQLLMELAASIPGSEKFDRLPSDEDGKS